MLLLLVKHLMLLLQRLLLLLDARQWFYKRVRGLLRLMAFGSRLSRVSCGGFVGVARLSLLLLLLLLPLLCLRIS